MGDALLKEKVTREFVWTLATPTNWVEVEKTLHWIKTSVKDEATYDDVVIVTVGDDEIRFAVDAKWMKATTVDAKWIKETQR